MKKDRPKRPTDVNALAAMIVQVATADVDTKALPPRPPPPLPDETATANGPSFDPRRCVITGEDPPVGQDTEIDDPIDLAHLAAAMLGRRGGLKGGHARAASLTKERRAEIAKKAAEARWNVKKTEKKAP